MKTCFTLALMAAILMLSCEEQSLKNNSGNVQNLSGNEFVLTIDRVAQHPDVQFPHDTLTESDYVPLDAPKEYGVKFSADGMKVTIDDSIIGSKISYIASCSKYDITDGLFAGGRFLVWKDNNKYEAEYTIYGSGVPVITSVRGEMRKK